LSRLRATLSPTEIDREIQLALDRAAREIEAALQVAVSAPVGRHRKKNTVSDLRQALEGVTRVRYLSPSRPEQESHEDWKARQAARQDAVQERQKAHLARVALREQTDA
jgi:hypothetical protein